MRVSRRQCCLALGLGAVSIMWPRTTRAIESLEWGSQGGQATGRAPHRMFEGLDRQIGQAMQGRRPDAPKRPRNISPKRKVKKPEKPELPPK